jgi:hypothetical protein
MNPMNNGAVAEERQPSWQLDDDPALWATTRRQTPCQCPEMRNGRRGRLPGGLTTGPRTAAGLSSGPF